MPTETFYERSRFRYVELADALREADFSEVQAKGLVSALAESAQDTIATKADIASLKVDIVTLRSDLRAEIAALRVDTAKWVIGAVAFNFVATAGLFATLFKLFAK